MFNTIFGSIKKKFNRNTDEYDINMQELKRMQKSGAQIVDVRSKMEYNEGHLDGAISVPEYEVKSHFKKDNMDKDTTIVVYCLSGYRSKRVCISLKKMGYNNVYNLYGGLEEY